MADASSLRRRLLSVSWVGKAPAVGGKEGWWENRVREALQRSSKCCAQWINGTATRYQRTPSLPCVAETENFSASPLPSRHQPSYTLCLSSPRSTSSHVHTTLPSPTKTTLTPHQDF